MAAITVSVDLDASPSEVWEYVRDIASHVEWMADARAIRFVGEQTSGVGTTFECDTVIGPIKLVDVMTITAWEEAKRMGVSHDGVVSGVGDFELIESDSGGTVFTWSEELTYPWWLGSSIGAFVSRPLLGAVWRRNLHSLKKKVSER